jgi:tRNA nucleotidyltransferase (CCA-adding enzyme)
MNLVGKPGVPCGPCLAWSKLNDELLVGACEADARGRLGLENRAYPQADFMRRVYQATAGAPVHPLLAQGLSGLTLAEALQRDRLAAITEVRQEYKTSSRA